MRQQLSTPRVDTRRRAERTASQKSSRCLPVATEHAASESPATTGKANWAGRKQDRNGPNGVSSRRKENDLSWDIHGWYLVTWCYFEIFETVEMNHSAPEAKRLTPEKFKPIYLEWSWESTGIMGGSSYHKPIWSNKKMPSQPSALLTVDDSSKILEPFVDLALQILPFSN